MFSQAPDKAQQPTKHIQNNPRRRRKRKASKRNKRIAKKDHTKRNNCFNTTMSSWAETFTTAATWQLKHQVAYWKSKATMLAYENQILHDIIRKNYLRSGESNPDDSQNVSVEPDEKCSEELNIDSDSEVEGNNEDFEVSEEFIQFLRENAKYKEDARREREQLKAQKQEQPMELCEQSPDEISELSEDKIKKLYGKDWQRIAALEMSIRCDFISECDKMKPMYWPNIPFNFS